MFSSRSRLFLAFTLIAAVAFSSSPSFARGGRGGGGGDGRGAGGDRAAGRNGPSSGISGNNFSRNPGQAGNSQRNIAGNQQFPGELQQAGQYGQPGTLNPRTSESQVLLNPYQQQVTQFQQRTISPNDGQAFQGTQDRTQNFQNGAENFSPAVGNDPQAWQYTHPHADAAVVATTSSVTAWMAPEYYEPTDSSSANEAYAEDPADATNASNAFADQVTANVSTDPNDWMPLGTYSLVTNPDTTPTFMLQLAIDRAGKLGGVYYDSLTNTSHNITGKLNRGTQEAQWYLANNPQLIFQAPLSELLKPSGTVEVNLATGAQEWQLVRAEKQ